MLKIDKMHLNHLRNDAHFQFHTEFRDLVVLLNPSDVPANGGEGGGI